MLRASEGTLNEHYGKSETWYQEKGAKRKALLTAAGKPVDASRPAAEYGKDIIRGIVRYMSATPLIAMVWEGNEAVAVVRKLVGTTDPTASDVGTIRGDLQLDSYSVSDVQERAIRNLIHCSDQPAEAEREIALWFGPEELHGYRHPFDVILEDANLDGSRE
jgi:nucleoside-diphosphate kinase